MKRILVIADDLTGAAEVAGAGVRHGLTVRLLRHGIDRIAGGLSVVDTDSRALTPEASARRHETLASALAGEAFDLIFKKTDSALRGNILTEIEALMRGLGLKRAIFLPQNPSRGRIIRRGEYFIDGSPLHQTAFAQDPDHPAHTSGVLRLLGQSRLSIGVIRSGDSQTTDIAVADAENSQDINSFAKRICLDCLPAGGVDFFAGILRARGFAPEAPVVGSVQGSALFICGSTSAYSRELPLIARQHGAAVCPLSDALFDQAGDADLLLMQQEVIEHLEARRRAVVVVPQKVQPQRAQAVSQTLAQLASGILQAHAVNHLLVSGGATAGAVAEKMGWSGFDVMGELADGVVRLKPQKGKTLLTIKPGSYHWPESVWEKPA